MGMDEYSIPTTTKRAADLVAGDVLVSRSTAYRLGKAGMTRKGTVEVFTDVLEVSTGTDRWGTPEVVLVLRDRDAREPATVPGVDPDATYTVAG